MILFKFMRPRKRDFRGDARKGAKNYDTVSSDDSEVYRRNIVEKILSQGGTGSARPAGGRNLKGCADKKNYSAEKLFFVDCRSL